MLNVQEKGGIVYLGKAAPASGSSSGGGGGIAPKHITGKSISKSGAAYTLKWTDPTDTVVSGETLCVWGGTIIVRKEGAYPENPKDGTVILDSKTRNQYATDGFVDTTDDASKDYKYRAFPYSINGAYNLEYDNMFGAWILEFTETGTESSAANRIVYGKDNADFTPCAMDFTNDVFSWGSWENHPIVSLDFIRPCMLKSDGTVDYYLDPNDHTKKYDSEDSSDVANTSYDGNAMVQMRRVFVRVVVTGDVRTYTFSNEKLDSAFECWGAKKADGTYAECWYAPMYPGSLIDSKLRSLSGQAVMKSKTAAQEITYATANGTGWYTETHADNQYFQALFKLLFKNTNAQAKLGEGVSSGGEAGLVATGTLNDKGMMYGSSSTSVGVKFCYMEHWWAHQWRRYAGHIYKDGKHYVKMTASRIDGSTADGYNTTGEGYIQLSVPTASGSSGSYIKESVVKGNFGEFPTVMSGGSESTYLCDGCWFNNSGTRYPCRGGHAGPGRFCGPWCLNVGNGASNAHWDFSAALSYHQ